MESFEKKIKERNNLLKSQVESLTGRNEVVEIIDTLLKAGVAEEDLVEKAKYIRREADGKGGYKYIYEEPKENKIKTDKVEGEKGKTNEELAQFHREQMELANKKGDGSKYHYHMSKRDIYKELAKKEKESKTDKVDKKEGKVSNLSIYSHKEGGMAATGEINGKKVSIRLPKEFVKTVDTFDNKEHRAKVKEMLLKEVTKSSESDLEKAEDNKKKEKIAKVMKEFKAGTLKTSSGEPVKDQKQAIAIAMSEAGMSVKKSTLSTVLKQVDNDIEKSHLGEFSYSEKLGIKKTGKEIKEKFKANLQKEQSEANELKAKLGVLKTKIGEEPTKKCDYWQIDAYEDKGLDIPLIYENYGYYGSETVKEYSSDGMNLQETTTTDTKKWKYEYNEIVRRYIDSQKEILQINTILNNYKDTDVYQLTISQATVLGF